MERLYALVFVISCFLNIHAGARAIGINYGLLGDNLPQPSQAISLLKSRNISKIRLFDPNSDVLTTLKGSGISIILGTRNQDLQSLSSDPSAAASWVTTNVAPYSSSINITHIAAGNEVVPGDLAQFVPGAIQNLNAALRAAGLSIPVTTVVSMAVLGSSFPPSQGNFSADANSTMTQITRILSTNKSPLMLNAYTFFPHASEPTNVPLDYALFEENVKPILDNALTYRNLFDAMVDTVYAALEKVGGSDVEIIVTETGWPTEGDTDASVDNAKTYNNNLVKHLSSGQGTPRRPGKAVEAYIFALFKENLKAEGVERNWGLYYPNMTEVYHVQFV